MNTGKSRWPAPVRYALVGGLIGLVLALVPFVLAYAAAPGMPGLFELAFQAVFVLLGVVVAAAIGAVVGLAASRS